MISLDGECLKIAEGINNFSGWVRDQLLKTVEDKKTKNLYQYECETCWTAWHVRSESIDDYFYCRLMMKGNCENKVALLGELIHE